MSDPNDYTDPSLDLNDEYVDPSTPVGTPTNTNTRRQQVADAVMAKAKMDDDIGAQLNNTKIMDINPITSLQQQASKNVNEWVGTSIERNLDLIKRGVSAELVNDQAARNQEKVDKLQAGIFSPEAFDIARSTVLATLNPRKVEMMDTEFIDDVAAEAYINAVVADAADKASQWGVTDIGGLLFVPDFRWDVAKLGEDLGIESKATGYINSTEMLFHLRRSMDKLPGKEKALVVSKLAKFLESEESNPLKREIILNDILTRSADQLAFDWDVMPAIAGLSGPAINATMKTASRLLGLNKAAKVSSDIGGRILEAVKANNVVKRAAKMGNPESAAKAADAAIRDPLVAKDLGVDQIDMMASGDPQAASLTDILTGAPSEYASEIHKTWREMDTIASEINNVTKELAPFTEAEKAAALDSRIKADVDLPEYDDIRWEDTDLGSKATFFRKNEMGEIEEIGSKEYELNIDDLTDTFITDKTSLISNTFGDSILSPNFTLGADREFLVDAAARFQFRSAKIRSDLVKTFDESIKDIQDADTVNWLLMKGDHEERVFTYQEAVLDGIGGTRISPEDFKAYAGIRKLYDQLWSIENSRAVKEKRFLGEKQVDVGEVKHYVRDYDSPQAAKSAAKQSQYQSAIVVREDGISVLPTVDSIDFDALYANGYRMVKSNSLEDTFDNGLNNSAGLAFVRADKINPVSGQVIGRKTGYINRIGKDTNFFVKRNTYRNIDGKKVLTGQASERVFKTKAAAERWLNKTLADRAAKGQKSDASEWTILFDKESNSAVGGESVFNASHGGLYRGKRKQTLLKMGEEGAPIEYVEPLEAVQRYIGHVGFRSNISTYRAGLQKKWMTSAQNWAGMPRNLSFEEGRDWVSRNDLSELVKDKLLKAHRQIDHITRVPTRAEAKWEGQIRAVGESIERTAGGEKIAPYIYKMKHTSVPDMLKAATFHVHLGFFNPAQIIVQGMAATAAASIHPVAALKALPKALGMNSVAHIPKSQRAEAIRKLADKGTDPDMIKASLDWEKSGIGDAILRNNPDYANALAGRPVGVEGMQRLWSGATQIVEKGSLLGFGMGELAARRLAFFTAWEVKKPLRGTMTDDEWLNNVVGYHDQLLQSMTSANKIEFQKGWWGVPLQFQQVIIKFGEQLLGSTGSKFTPGQRMRLLAGQAAFFGAAGVPLLTWLMDTMTPAEVVADLSAETKTVIRRGVIGWLVNEQFSVDALVTGRLALGQGITDMFKELSTEDQNIGKFLLGPLGSTLDRSVSLLNNLLQLGKGITWGTETTTAEVQATAEILLEDLVSIPSTGRNALEGRKLLAQHVAGNSTLFKSNNGSFLYETDAPNLQTVVARFMGFGSQIEADAWEVIHTERQFRQTKKEAVNSALRLIDRMVTASDAEGIHQYNMALNMLLNSYEGTDRIEVYRGIRDRLMKRGEGISRNINDQIMQMNSEFANSAILWNQLSQEAIDQTKIGDE